MVDILCPLLKSTLSLRRNLEGKSNKKHIASRSRIASRGSHPRSPSESQNKKVVCDVSTTISICLWILIAFQRQYYFVVWN